MFPGEANAAMQLDRFGRHNAGTRPMHQARAHEAASNSSAPPSSMAAAAYSAAERAASTMHHHVGELVLHRLERADHSAELHALLGIVHRGVTGRTAAPPVCSAASRPAPMRSTRRMAGAGAPGCAQHGRAGTARSKVTRAKGG